MPAAERAYRAVKQAILSGESPGGRLLSEAEVGTQLGLSRTPVHEAFLRLQAEGLLDLLPRRGAVVVPVAPGEARDVLEVRRALETAAVRRLAEAAAAEREALDARLAALLADQRSLAAEQDVAAFAQADAAFHVALLEASGNTVALRLYATLADRQQRMTIGSVGRRPEHLATLVDEHRTLAALVLAGDVDGFDDAVTTHLGRTHAVLLGGAL
ncbi:GntR family transcriptional regulator [Nocardioides sp. GY 10127]|nr:GntR family transcriptional regulator [Nocardioides sp. GY 10127]